MNATLLAMVLWGAAALGVVAAISAIALPRLRRVLFIVAAVLASGGRRPRTPTPSST
jgi:hypothetical protein